MISTDSIVSIIKAHKATLTEDSRVWDRHREMYKCSQLKKVEATDPIDTGNDQDVVFESGSLFAYADSMVSSVVPPNPKITANPYNSGHLEMAKGRESLVNSTFARAKAHRTLWQAGLLSCVYPRSFIKVVWKHNAKRPDYINIDPRHIFYDKEAEKWEDVRYLIEITVLTQAEFESRVQHADPNAPADPLKVYDREVARHVKYDSYPMWLRQDTTQTSMSEKQLDVFKWAVVYEVWDFTDPIPRYYHYLEDQKVPLYAGPPPYMFLRNPFWLVKFNENLQDNGGLSDASIIENPVRRLDECRTLELRHAQATIPVTILNGAAVDSIEDAKEQLRECTSPGDIFAPELKNGASIKDAIGQTPTAALSPSFTTAKQALEQEIMFRLGMPQYTRGIAGSSDVATELALIDSALRTRQGRRIEVISDAIWFMATATVYLYEQFLAPDDTIFARVGDGKTERLDRATMQFREVEEAQAILRTGAFPEDAMTIDYEVVPYSPTENSKSSKLKKIAEFSQLMLAPDAAPHVSRKKFYAALTDLLELGDLTPDPSELRALAGPAAPGPTGGAPGGAPDPSQIGTGTDESLNGGEMPSSVEPPPVSAETSATGGGAGAKLPNSLRR